MKRLLILTICAVCAAAAQAVTIGWESKGSVTSGTAVALDTSYSASLSVALVFNMDSIPTAANVPNSFMSVMSDTLCAGLGNGLNGSGGGSAVRATLSTNGSAPDAWRYNIGQTAGGTLKAGENVLGIVFRKESGNTYIDWYINGTLVNNIGSQYSGVYTDVAFDEVVIGSDVTNGGKLYVGQGAATAADFAVLPEPTVLALLALGVAGLALRRKIA